MPTRNAEHLLSIIEEIYRIQELDSLLENVLTKARRFLKADAGTLYLKAKNKLFFSFIQNDTLFLGDKAEMRYIYSSRYLPLDNSSLAGYVAKTGESILIDDVYDIHSNVDYSFNPNFDKKSHYRTKSMLIVPLKTPDGTVVGVLQLINAKNRFGNVVPFSKRDELYLNQFAQYAASAIEKARLSKEMVLRMVDLTSIHDPFETSQHAKRVGAYAVELFDKWASAKNVSHSKIQQVREYLKTAAMLHDIGKVAVSDTILKRAGSLSPEQSLEMQKHTVYGSRLFKHKDSYWDLIAAQVALNHHERWDGTGYPGKYEVTARGGVKFGPGKKGTEIPWSARVVTIVDVYDALLSRRAYKKAWPKDQVIDYLKKNSGTQFDPGLVKVFLKMQNVADSIQRKYSY
jgi:HD-GYP domain-containing protein (c-di-GMP phosphodiesterase class II)